MTRSSRVLNRLILAILGLVLLAVGAALAAPPLRDLVPWRPDLGDPVVLWALVATAAVFVVVAISWITTRGRGHTRLALRTDGLDVEARVVTTILSERLAASPDVLSVAAGAYLRRGRRLVRVVVRTRRHPDLPALRTAVASGVAALDRAIGTPLPLVVHVTTGVRTALTPARTTR